MVDDKAQLNPYQTPQQPTEPRVRRKGVQGFSRGFRNGMLWSIPVQALLVIYGIRSNFNVQLISAGLMAGLIWSFSAGFRTALEDRNRSSESESQE